MRCQPLSIKHQEQYGHLGIALSSYDIIINITRSGSVSSQDRSGHELIPHPKKDAGCVRNRSRKFWFLSSGSLDFGNILIGIFAAHIQQHIRISSLSQQSSTCLLQNGSPKLTGRSRHPGNHKKIDHGHSLVSYVFLSRSAPVSIALFPGLASVSRFASTLESLMGRRWSICDQWPDWISPFVGKDFVFKPIQYYGIFDCSCFSCKTSSHIHLLSVLVHINEQVKDTFVCPTDHAGQARHMTR